LTNVTLPYARRLAGEGLRAALEADKGLALGANVMRGAITHPGVAKAFDRELVPLADVLV
jgi:alanine dehydrogenase